VYDAIAAEKLGIPGLGVMTDRFLPTARAMAAARGLPEYPVACIAHPISNNTEAEMQRKADQVVEQALELLLRRA
jgi:hypothetical protein